jgi:hypothetical protein
MKVFVRPEVVEEDVFINSEECGRLTPEEIDGGELLSENDDEGLVTVRLKDGRVVTLENIDLDYE